MITLKRQFKAKLGSCCARLAIVAIAASGVTHVGRAADALKIGVLTDMAGPTADLVGRGSVIAAEMAAEDAGGTVLGRRIEILSADHQYKSDVGAAIVRRWFDTEGVEAVADVTASVIALAVQGIAQEKKKIALISGSGSLDLFGKACSPTGFVWSFDTEVLPKTVVQGVMASGRKTWFFITPDFSFGKQMVAAATENVIKLGGSVAGTVRTSIGTGDFGSALNTAQGSGAQVLGLALGGHDLINAMKQASEFGVRERGQQIVTMFTMITDVHAIGLESMQGAELATAFYWDLDDDTRAFGKRFYERLKRFPTMLQAGVYSSVTHYLKAVKAAGTVDSAAVAKTMKDLPVEDLTTKGARIRGDGRVVRDMLLVRVKKPNESKYPWDYYTVLQRVPGEQLMSRDPSPDCMAARH
jgi:branched-chain amino acid transport system substrate-binding protein